MNARNRKLRWTAIIRAMAITATLAATEAGAAAGDYAPGRLLIKFKSGVSESEVAQLLKANMSRELRRLNGIDLRIIAVPAQFETTLAAQLSQDPRVQFAEPDAVARPRQLTANDTYYSYAWHLTQVGAPVAWDFTLGRGVIVAVVDSGVDGTHPDLVANLVPGYNAVSNNTDTSDTFGHGTKVAGIIGATSNNSSGVTSLAWDVSIMPVRISEASDGYANSSDIVEGLRWAVDHGARVANVSYALSQDGSLSVAAEYARSHNCVVIMPAGNDDQSVGSYDNPHVITVGATDNNDLRTSWSNYGPGTDLSAPGSGIVTTSLGGYYASATGTSFAAPVVAGIAALVIAARPELAAADVEQVLEDSAIDLGTAGWDQYYGYGRVDAAAAVQLALAWTPPVSDTQAPSVAITAPAASVQVSGTLSVQIDASDNVAVTEVRLFANGTLVRSDTTAPYAIDFNTKTYANGTVQLSARAYDAAGNEALGTPVSVTVYNAPVDTTPPTAAITSPTSKSVTGTVTVSATASDNVQVATMALYVDNTPTPLCTGTSTVLDCDWNAQAASRGNHVIKLTAVDSSGNTTNTQISVRR